LLPDCVSAFIDARPRAAPMAHRIVSIRSQWDVLLVSTSNVEGTGSNE
jgi:hypothetical protein